jgi:pimeloyl-ACP methyl ester carboxylesterase
MWREILHDLIHRCIRLLRVAARDVRKSNVWARVFTGLIVWGALSGTGQAQTQSSLNPPSRPILFIHGICGDSASWEALRQSLFLQLNQEFPSLYPKQANPDPANPEQNYDVYYDGIAVRFLLDSIPVDETSIPPAARFFSIRFFDPNGGGFDASKVAQISILNKANELALVLQEITRVTEVKDVILVAHSMGGLVARAYLENMASQGICYNYNGGSEGTTAYSNGLCYPGEISYRGDVAGLITIDTPHGGTDLAAINDPFSTFDGLFPCEGGPSTTKTEMVPQSELLQNLNYFSSSISEASTISSQLEVQSIESYFSDGDPLWDLVVGINNDTVISFTNQSMELNLAESAKSGTQFGDWGNPYAVEAITPQSACEVTVPNFGTVAAVLHYIQCVGAQPNTQALVYLTAKPILLGDVDSITVQATLDTGSGPQPWPGQGESGPITFHLQQSGTVGPSSPILGTAAPSTFTGIPVGTYELVYDGGGPSGRNVQVPSNLLTTTLNSQNWNPTLTFEFVDESAPEPAVTTLAASAVGGDDATLNGSVNAYGAATTAWFEWGISSTLTSFTSTGEQVVAAGTSVQAVSSALSGLESNMTYYYRVAISNGGVTVRGSILSFTTLGALPEPVLESPVNSVSGISTTPTFSWTTVTNATSYRLIVATAPSALPTDPTVATCGTGCALNVTPTSTTYSPASGTLEAGITYYWEVHARSANQYGDWSAIFSFTVGATAVSDFSLQVTPTSQSVTLSNTVAFGVVTTTTSGQPQTIALSVGNLPAGAIPVFTPNLLTSGSSGILGITTSSSTPQGTYTLTVVASGSSSSHSSQISLTVISATSGGANASISPTSWTFSDQLVGTISQAQSFTVRNVGSGQLTINNISLATGGDYVISGVTGYPLTIVPNGQFEFEIQFDPSITGQRMDRILIWSNSPTSPQMIPIAGNGLQAPATNGTVQVIGTLNNAPLPNTAQFSYPFSYAIEGPTSLTGGGAEIFTAAPGNYTISFLGNPGYFTLSSITPSATQPVTAGNTTTFTLNFTAPSDFLNPSFLYPADAVPAQVVLAGTTANYTVGTGVPPDNAAIPVSLVVVGTPPGANSTFNPEPAYSNTDSTLAVVTDVTATPPGAYTLTLSGTNPSGLTRPGDTSSLLVTTPPAIPVQLISMNTAGTQADSGSSYTTNSAVSADGRYVVFASGASNLSSASTSDGQTYVYVRDTQLRQTTLASVSNSGAAADFGASNPTISSNGRYVAFVSQSDNLPLAPPSGASAVYMRDLLLAQTEREDVTSSGTSANGSSSSEPNISADGRFVAFISNATNLVPGVTSTNEQVFVRDRNSGNVVLASIGVDGSWANQGASLPSISADGRFVAFYSSSSNLVSQNTGDMVQVYVRDLQVNRTVLASAANGGSAANSGVLSNYNAPAISADGRFVAFSSNATNLVPGAIDANGDFRAFLKDLQSQTTTLIDTDALGVPLSQGGIEPTISADGRFVAYAIYGQTIVRDMTGGHSAVVSLATNGSPSNNLENAPSPPSISYGGTSIALVSSATNLVASDTNGTTDIFLAQNSIVGVPDVVSIVLNSPSVGGGSSVTGTIFLNGPAPSAGSSVVLSCNNSAVGVPPIVLIPPGQTSAAFSLDTATVSVETPLTILASYNGSAAVAVLTLQPASTLDIAPASMDFGDQPANTTSNATELTISNAGTVALSINSISLASGQFFKITANTCASSVPAGSACSVSVAFSPTASGLASDSIQINFGAPASVRSVSLLGNGAMPSVSLSPGTVNFGSEVIQGTTLATTTVTDIGSAPLVNIVASIGGPNAADFAINTDKCAGTTLAINNSCLVTINFSPKATGSRNATLFVSDNAPGSPQTVSLYGTASDFSLGAVTGASSSQTITAGQTATFNLQINAANGFTGQVTFGCMGAPLEAICSVNPTSAAVSGSQIPFTVTVATTSNSALPPDLLRTEFWHGLEYLTLILMLVVLGNLLRERKLRASMLAALLVVVLVGLTSCGGGTGSSYGSNPTGSSGTPAGTYTITVTGSFGAVTRTIALTLTVN